MSLKLINIKTGNTAQPIYVPGAAELALASSPNVLAWLEGGSGFLKSDGSVWYDRKTGAAYPVTGTLAAGTAINGFGAMGFSTTQSVNLGSIFPVSGDYTLLSVYRQTKVGNCCLVGSSGASYHSFHLASNGGLNSSHAATGIVAGAVPHALSTPSFSSLTWDQATGTQRAYFGGTLEVTPTAGRPSNTDSSCIVGALPGLNSSLNFGGDIAATLVVSLDFSKAANATFAALVNSYLKTKYAV